MSFASIRKVVPYGAPERELGSFYALHEDCSSSGQAIVRISVPPGHGAASVREESSYPHYREDNPRVLCNAHAVPATVVYYAPAPGYAGRDSLVVDVIFPDGGNWQRRYDIIVK